MYIHHIKIFITCYIRCSQHVYILIWLYIMYSYVFQVVTDGQWVIIVTHFRRAEREVM